MLVTLYDLGNVPTSAVGPQTEKNKFGYIVPVTFEGAEAMLRQYVTDLPPGDLVDIFVDRERDIVTFKYRCQEGSDDSFNVPRVGQGGSYPHRGGGA